MNKSNLIGGIICLAIAGGLTIANLTLPPENIMFQIGDQNMPWVPPVVLAIIGVVLLVNANKKKEEAETTEQNEKQPVEVDPEKAALNKRLETVFWGLFLIMLGGWLFIPKETVPKGLWSIGVGLLLLGLNGARYYNKLRMSGFTTFLGILSLVGGAIEVAGFANMDGALLLIILGAYLVLKPWFEKQGLFGKAEEK